MPPFSSPLLLLLSLACQGQVGKAGGGSRQGEAEEGPDGAGAGDGAGDGADGSTDTDTADDSAEPSGPCPSRMALVSETLCIDIAEGALEEEIAGEWASSSPYLTVDGREVRAVVAWEAVPQGYISGDEAEAACAASGKRLCTSEEWLAACRGPDDWLYPYGDDPIDGTCNDHYAGSHPVIDYFGTSEGIWDMDHMNDPGINQQEGTVAAGGEYSGCVGPVGAWDMHGNLHEWVTDSEGTFRGGFYADASINGPGCTYTTTAHERGYHDYSTGFRCCADFTAP